MAKKTVSKYWCHATVLLGCAVAFLSWERYQTQRALRNVFHYRYHITVVDAESGKILWPSVSYPTVSRSDLFSQTYGVVAETDGSMIISGVAYTPRSFDFAVDGYRTERLTIRPGSTFAAEMSIKMKPEANP
jgi:hypothetical protein